MIQRAITAFILLGIASVVTAFGGMALLGWVWLISIGAAYEMFSMIKRSGAKPYEWTGYALITLAIVGTYFDHHLLVWSSAYARAVALLLIGGVITELIFRRIWVAKSNLVATLRVVVFVVFTFTYIYLLRSGNNGLVNFLFCLLVVWSNDSAALLGGRWLGRTPLSSISPKKTVEGSVIGLIVGVLIAWAYMAILATFWHFHLHPLFYSLLAIGIGLVSQLGDLHESLFKRFFGVKDSSGILPGHGGVYDRADSTLLIAPIAFYLFNG